MGWAEGLKGLSGSVLIAGVLGPGVLKALKNSEENKKVRVGSGHQHVLSTVFPVFIGSL